MIVCFVCIEQPRRRKAERFETDEAVQIASTAGPKSTGWPISRSPAPGFEVNRQARLDRGSGARCGVKPSTQ